MIRRIKSPPKNVHQLILDPESVRAVQSGEMTEFCRVTGRLGKINELINGRSECSRISKDGRNWNFWISPSRGRPEFKHVVRCPYGKTGDRLWVREPWRPLTDPFAIEYRADNLVVVAPNAKDYEGLWRCDRWRSSLHMPRWACRLVLTVQSVDVARLQDVSGDEDAWDKTNAKRHPWRANPLVWVVKLEN
tara:strand:- start:2823 stop:3395 length:573 start_codon:yes stop_codon:yes gene_type:complete